jgi:hypothetical protein
MVIPRHLDELRIEEGLEQEETPPSTTAQAMDR